jgi:hypothetical protein
MIWLMNLEIPDVRQGDRIKELIACLSYSLRLPNFYMVVIINFPLINVCVAFVGD